MNPEMPALHSALPHSPSPLCLVIPARRERLRSPFLLLSVSCSQVLRLLKRCGLAPNCPGHGELWADALCEGAPKRNNFE